MYLKYNQIAVQQTIFASFSKRFWRLVALVPHIFLFFTLVRWWMKATSYKLKRLHFHFELFVFDISTQFHFLSIVIQVAYCWTICSPFFPKYNTSWRLICLVFCISNGFIEDVEMIFHTTMLDSKVRQNSNYSLNIIIANHLKVVHIW